MQGRSFMQKRFRFGTVKFFKKNTTSKARAGVVVSKKTNPLSVGRNRIRRRIYHAIRGLLTEHEIPHNIVVYPTSEALTAKFSELKEALLGALSR